LRPDIPVVGSKFTLALIAAKCREHRIKPVFVEVAEKQSSKHGVFECEYFAVNHSIPDALAIAVYTGAGTLLHTGDIKLDQLPLDGRPTDLPGMSRLGDAGVDLFLCDSTNAEIPGVGPSESEIGPNMHRLIRGAEGRVIVACFASNVARVQQIIDASVALGRKVSFVGRSPRELRARRWRRCRGCRVASIAASRSPAGI
jgi:ribonuclease J